MEKLPRSHVKVTNSGLCIRLRLALVWVREMSAAVIFALDWKKWSQMRSERRDRKWADFFYSARGRESLAPRPRGYGFRRLQRRIIRK